MRYPEDPCSSLGASRRRRPVGAGEWEVVRIGIRPSESASGTATESSRNPLWATTRVNSITRRTGPAEPVRLRFRAMATDTKVTEENVYEALEEVIDPELGLDFVSLGLVYDVEIENGEVFVTFTLTTPACPIGPQVSEQMREFVSELDGVEKVHPKMVFDPPWSPEMMSEDAKFALGY